MTNYTEQALVFIGSSVILVPIFHRLGFGSIIGYLMAGILVGPSGFKLIPDSQSVLHFAEFGESLLKRHVKMKSPRSNELMKNLIY